jgi:hypothetical protein
MVVIAVASSAGGGPGGIATVVLADETCGVARDVGDGLDPLPPCGIESPGPAGGGAPLPDGGGLSGIRCQSCNAPGGWLPDPLDGAAPPLSDPAVEGTSCSEICATINGCDAALDAIH